MFMQIILHGSFFSYANSRAYEIIRTYAVVFDHEVDQAYDL